MFHLIARAVISSIDQFDFCQATHALATPNVRRRFTNTFYTRKGCGVVPKPKQEYCCVFCSNGDVPCSPVQESAGCCGENDPPSWSWFELSADVVGGFLSPEDLDFGRGSEVGV